MTFHQGAIICLLLGMFGVFALERFRVEMVAVAGLAAGWTLGLVPAHAAFDGFSSPAVITVAEILLIVGVLTRVHVLDPFADAIVARAKSERAVLAILCVAGTLVSVPINNIGALSLMIPLLLSVCSRLGISPARMLMPLSFATLLGGLCSLTGTPANLIVNDWLIARTGHSFDYFELGLVGGPVALAGVVWLVLSAPRPRRDDDGEASAPQAVPADFLCEATIPRRSRLAGLSLPAAEEAALLRIHDVFRAGAHVFARRGDIVLQPGDVLIAEGAMARIDALAEAGDIQLGDAPPAPGERLEVVTMPDSTILGSHLGWLDAFAAHDVGVVALASRHPRIEGRFEDLQIGLGDVLILSGEREAMRNAAADAGVMPLSPPVEAQRHPAAMPSLLVFAAGVAATAFDIVPPEIAFGGVVVAMMLLGSLGLRTGLRDMNWPIVILLACMIPLGKAVESTGAAQVIADAIVAQLPSTHPFPVVLAMLVMTVLITPFVDNVSTAAVLSPIAAGIAARTGVAVEPLLVAVAIGTSLDFLTPFGHHNNAVVMGAGGYRFVDFPRLGAPLLLLCVVVAQFFIWFFWLR